MLELILILGSKRGPRQVKEINNRLVGKMLTWTTCQSTIQPVTRVTSQGGHDVSNHWKLYYLLNILFRLTSKDALHYFPFVREFLNDRCILLAGQSCEKIKCPDVKITNRLDRQSFTTEGIFPDKITEIKHTWDIIYHAKILWKNAWLHNILGEC